MTKEDFHKRVKPGVHVIAIGLKYEEEMIVKSVSQYSAYLITVRQPSGGFTRTSDEIACIVGDEVPEPSFVIGDIIAEKDNLDNSFKIDEVTDYLYVTNPCGYLFLSDQQHFTKMYNNPGYGIDCDDRKYITSFEMLERYIWEHQHGEEVKTLYEKFPKKEVDALFSLGYIYSGLGVHYNITKRGKNMFDLKFKPRTLWEKFQDWFYFKILRIKIEFP